MKLVREQKKTSKRFKEFMTTQRKGVSKKKIRSLSFWNTRDSRSQATQQLEKCEKQDGQMETKDHDRHQPYSSF